MKLNKTRQKLYLDGKVGLINDGTVEQLREVTNDREYMGRFTYYHKNRIFPSDAPLDNVQYHPIAWFYENETELPKRVKYLGKVWDVVDYDMKLNKYGLALLDTSGTYVANVAECTPITEPTPTSYKLNIDLPNMGYKKGDIIKKREYTQIYYGNKKTEKMTRIHVDLLQYIATPIYTQPFTLENGTEIELTNNDIDKIKKL